MSEFHLSRSVCDWFVCFCFQYFQKELPPKAEANPDKLMNAAYEIKINMKRMKKLEKEYTALKTKEQEEMIELKVREIRDKIRAISKRWRFVNFIVEGSTWNSTQHPTENRCSP